MPVSILTHHVSSLSFRRAKIALKRIQKAVFEKELLLRIQSVKADVLVCDSYMLILSKYFLSRFSGTVINIHPGITNPNDIGWLPGATPTRDAITRAKFGYIIVDDKKHVPHPPGRSIEVEYEGQPRKAVYVGVLGRSGVTCHRVTEQIDSGPIIAEATYNFEPKSITEEQLRTWNYTLKFPVFLAAMRNLLADESGTKAIPLHASSKFRTEERVRSNARSSSDGPLNIP